MANPSTETEIALISSDVRHLTRAVEELRHEIRDVKDDLAKISEMATRWKGGFLVIAGVGGLLGWIASIWDKVSKPWH